MRRGLVIAAVVAGGVVAAAVAASAETLTVSVSGRGTVTSVPRAIACPPKCRVTLAQGKSITLVAKPRAGWRFGGWAGGCRSQVNPRCTVWLRTAKRVHARFRPVAPPPPPPPTPRPTLAPQTLAGTWAGTWRNPTTGASGAASIRFQVPDTNTIIVTFNFADVFGCANQPIVVTLAAGTGPNTWNASGFNVQVVGAAGGSIGGTYDAQTRALVATGRAGCNQNATYELRGTFEPPSFAGTLTVSAGGATARFDLALTRPAPP